MAVTAVVAAFGAAAVADSSAYKSACLAAVHDAAAAIIIPLEMAIGLTPAVHLKRAPESPPAATAPAMSCFPRALSMMASTEL